MAEIPIKQLLIKAGSAVATIVVIGVIIVATAGLWMPMLRNGIGALSGTVPDPHAGDDPEDNHGAGDPDTLVLSAKARKSMAIRVGPLERSDYERSVRIPGQVVKIPGLTERDITAKSSGEIDTIRVVEGQLIRPGSALFDIELTHEEAIQNQLEMLDALAKLEVANAEIARLEKIWDEQPGSVPRTKILTQRYERAHLQHTIASRRQILALLGLPANDIEELIQRHQVHHNPTIERPMDHDHDAPLIERITVYVPRDKQVSTTKSGNLVIEKLNVRHGEHVDVGSLLCRLGDYGILYIKGQAFERDLEIVRRARDQGWGVTAVLPQRHDDARRYGQLPIVKIASIVDAQSRSAQFYVQVQNSLREPPPLTTTVARTDADYADWQLKPGQRIELHVPVERLSSRLVLPSEAIARDGVENYVFQFSGDTFVRRKVAVLIRDERRAVLSDDDDVLEGKSLAMSGAYQLQLSLLNRGAGPVQHDHGGGAHSH